MARVVGAFRDCAKAPKNREASLVADKIVGDWANARKPSMYACIVNKMQESIATLI